MENDVKFYQASTSELYGNVKATPQNENTPFCPRSPYGAAKLYAHNMCQIYKEAYGLYICCGILFNHESPRRGLNFVTRKITHTVCEIARGEKDVLYLGNLDSLKILVEEIKSKQEVLKEEQDVLTEEFVTIFALIYAVGYIKSDNRNQQ